jgi:hypothetical protein
MGSGCGKEVEMGREVDRSGNIYESGKWKW